MNKKIPCRKTGGEYCPCPLEDAAEVISKRWTLSILVTIGNFTSVRFNYLFKKLKLNPKTLSERLKCLEKMKLINRKAYAETPPRVEYTLTKEGIALRKAVIPLMRWAEKR